ncbi:MAG: ion transporter [Solobacterium sp.]|nr:ion transporter [Solobacterium sp.]
MSLEKKGWRYKLFQLVDYVDSTGDGRRNIDYYDFFMIFCISLSLIPLLFKEENEILKIIDLVTVTFFIIDYLLRWMTADYRLEGITKSPFLLHPFTLPSLVDLLSILPSLVHISSVFKLLRFFRMFRSIRVLRSIKAIRVLRFTRYSASYEIIVQVLKDSKEALIAVVTMAVMYIFISALIIFNVEPDSFENFFEAVYWATISLTTVGYGDIYPVSMVGRIVAMVSSVFGIAIVALPAGIVTAGYMSEIQKRIKD